MAGFEVAIIGRIWVATEVWQRISIYFLWNISVSRQLHSKDNHLRDCAKYIVLSIPRPSEVPVEITREKIVENAFKNGTDATLGV